MDGKRAPPDAEDPAALAKRAKQEDADAACLLALSAAMDSDTQPLEEEDIVVQVQRELESDDSPVHVSCALAPSPPPEPALGHWTVMGSRVELDYVVVGRAGEVLVSARGVEVFPHATAPTGAAPLLLGSHLARHPKQAGDTLRLRVDSALDLFGPGPLVMALEGQTAMELEATVVHVDPWQPTPAASFEAYHHDLLTYAGQALAHRNLDEATSALLRVLAVRSAAASLFDAAHVASLLSTQRHALLGLCACADERGAPTQTLLVAREVAFRFPDDPEAQLAHCEALAHVGAVETALMLLKKSRARLPSLNCKRGDEFELLCRDALARKASLV